MGSVTIKIKLVLSLAVLVFIFLESYFTFLDHDTRPTSSPFLRQIKNSIQYKNGQKKYFDSQLKKIDQNISNLKQERYSFYCESDPDYIFLPYKNFHGREFFKRNNSVIFDVRVNTDDKNRRISISNNAKILKTNRLLFGGSRVFGWGLEDSETLSSDLNQIDPKYEYYNYATPGQGLQSVYSFFNKHKIEQDGFNNKQRIDFIYVFDAAHLGRLTLDFNSIHASQGPYIQLINNHIVTKDSFWTGDYRRTLFVSWMSQSIFLRHFNFFGLNNPSSKDCKLFSYLINEVEKKSLEQFPNSRFYPITFYNSSEVECINQQSELAGHKKIINMNISEFNQYELSNIEKYHFKYDNHPNKPGVKLMAEALNDYLKN